MSTDPENFGVIVTFFENKSTPKETDPWMYITVNSKSAHYNSLNEFITDDENKTRAEASNLKASTLNLTTNHPILILNLSFNDEHKHNELIAYEEFEN